MSTRDTYAHFRLRRMWPAVPILLVLSTLAAPAAGQDQSTGKITVGILPFDDASGTGISSTNIAALGSQLRAQLIRSGQLTPKMLVLAPGTALPLDSQQASELGRSAKVDLVVAPTVIKAESKSSQKGASSGRSIFGVSIGSAKATTVNAESRMQVELIRVSDGEVVDRFTVEGKKSASSVSTDAGGLGSGDASSPNFQSSPLGQAVREAMEKLSGEVEKRSPSVLASAQSAPNPPTASASGGQNPTQIASSSAVPSTGSGASTSTRSGAGEGSNILGIRPFSADQDTFTGKEQKTAKVYAIENAMRIEGVDNKGRKATTIMRFDRKIIWNLVPDQKMYVEVPWAVSSELAAVVQRAPTRKESLGTESVGPYQCEKFRVRVTLEGHVYTGLQWEAKELDGFVVKSADESGQWSKEYRNVKLGPQDASLFEIPAGYQKLNLFGKN